MNARPAAMAVLLGVVALVVFGMGAHARADDPAPSPPPAPVPAPIADQPKPASGV